MTAHLERRLTIFVADFLRRAMPADVEWSHFPAGEHRSAVTGALLNRMGTKPGWADFHFILPPKGSHAEIELKAERGKLSPSQIAHRDAVHAAGGLWAVCRTADEVEATLRLWGVPLRASLGVVG